MSTQLKNADESIKISAKRTARPIRIVGAAFGDPMAEKTFSGVSKYLFRTLDKHKVLTHCINTRQIRISEMFNGALKFSQVLKCRKPCVSSSWIWKSSTVDNMTERFKRRLCGCDGADTVLQIGTHVRVEARGIRHFCLTDMTLIQAARADQFTAMHLNDRQLAEAIVMQKRIFDSCEGIFVDSAWAKGSIVGDYGIASEKVCVSGLGASIRPISNEHVREKFNILFVGRDWKRKGGDILVKAFHEVRKHIKDATLTIIGCSPPVSDPNIKVLGRLNKETVSEYRAIRQAFCKASVFCVPSLFEPFGICFLESQLYGVPVVTFEGQGRADAVKDGVTGMLIKEKSAEALSQALIKLLVDTELAHRMGSAGRDFVVNNYTWDHVAERILDRMENHNEL